MTRAERGESSVGVAGTGIRLRFQGLRGLVEGQLQRAAGIEYWSARIIGLMRFPGTTLIPTARFVAANSTRVVKASIK